MGIKHSRALAASSPTANSRENFTEEDLTELAGSRASPRTPQRQRGLWSFLTWQFVIAPIVAAAFFFIENGHALATEDQDDRAADHQKGQPDAASDHDQAAAALLEPRMTVETIKQMRPCASSAPHRRR